MNIFITDVDPTKCAKYLDNKRVVKMILESTQMLCTALNVLSEKQITRYKSTHVNHPCNVWVRQRIQNWRWLYNHAKALAKEYTRRYGKRHKCEDVLQELKQINLCIPYQTQILEDRTPFPNCARNASLNIDYTNESNVYLAYQQYLNDRWDNDKLEPTWDIKI